MTSPGDTTTKWIGMCATATGSAHKRRDLPCEDAAGTRARGPWSAVAVADGHGSSRHPRAAQGAAFAVAAALDALVTLPNSNLDDLLGRLRLLPGALHRSWRSTVEAAVAEQPLTEDEGLATGIEGTPGSLRAYGSTLLGATASDRWLALVQLGDGDIVVGRAGGSAAGRPIRSAETSDPRRTDSLCHADAPRRTRVALIDLVEAPVEVVLLATDGFGAAFDQPDWHDETARQLVAAARDMSDDTLAAAVRDWCGPPAQVGGDDVSLGVLVPTRRNHP